MCWFRAETHLPQFSEPTLDHTSKIPPLVLVNEPIRKERLHRCGIYRGHGGVKSTHNNTYQRLFFDVCVFFVVLYVISH